MSDVSFVQTRKDGLTTKIKAIPTDFQNKLVQRPDMAETNRIQMEYLKLTGPETTENTLSNRLLTVALAQVDAYGAMLQGIKDGLSGLSQIDTVVTQIGDGVV